ncbi:hypothetical protein, partial [Faecalibacterium sp. An192]|uniref:hypothetical protein n=1 Tax=Faecalibacterium sp. An192 TaxID=1965581 RepID=UPI0019D0A9EC
LAKRKRTGPQAAGVPLLGGWVGLDDKRVSPCNFKVCSFTAVIDSLDYQPAEAGMWSQSERRAKAVKKKPGRLL